MEETQLSTEWFPRRQAPSASAIRLMCFPHAGGGSAIFYRLKHHLEPQIELLPARLPGREGRFNEEPFCSLDDLLKALVSDVRDIFTEPYALMGHSMGAFLSFELARLVRRQGLRAPDHLIVVAARAPQLAPHTPLLHVLSDDELLANLKMRYGDTPADGDERLIRALLPTIRADLTMIENYQFRHDTPLECPILAIGGRDDPSVQPADVAGWREQTAARFSQRTIAGGHFLLNQTGPQVMQLVSRKLAARASSQTSHD